MERILILEEGERWIDELDDLDRSELEDSNFLVNGLEDPVALSVFLFTAESRENGYSYEKLIKSVCDKEFVGGKDVATERQLKQMGGKEIVEHWLKLTKRLFLQNIE
jgi:hypothetical protein